MGLFYLMITLIGATLAVDEFLKKKKLKIQEFQNGRPFFIQKIILNEN